MCKQSCYVVQSKNLMSSDCVLEASACILRDFLVMPGLSSGIPASSQSDKT